MSTLDLLTQRRLQRCKCPELNATAAVTSSTLLPTISGAPGVIDQTEQSQELEIKAYAKLKKDELAAKNGVELAETGYLPDMLVTPVRVGRFEMTGSGFAVAAE